MPWTAGDAERHTKKADDPRRQRMWVEIANSVLSNLPMKVCLHVANSINSQIVIGEPGAESLLGKGDLLCDVGRGIVRAQSYFIPQQAFVKAVRGTRAQNLHETLKKIKAKY